ncbi:MAG: SGNH/GDSL hydrolase family protein [Clostridia bacterium]|nr:SGNH/GDSL hydrolase family protein [Clostridia bacterium]
MRILFQGDSITDAGRSRNDEARLGYGYATLVEASLGLEEAGKHEFINRGISGNRIVDLYARIKADIINLKPDLISILIGVNDVWHELGENPNGVDADKFFKVYSMLIEEIKEALPDVKIIILEPFVLKGCSTIEKWEYFEKEVPLRAEASRKIAEKYSLPFVELQKGFDELCKKAPEAYWLCDGVHPSAKGHEYIKSQWLKAYYQMND